jgi:hypothetical protein
MRPSTSTIPELKLPKETRAPHRVRHRSRIESKNPPRGKKATRLCDDRRGLLSIAAARVAEPARRAHAGRAAARRHDGGDPAERRHPRWPSWRSDRRTGFDHQDWRRAAARIAARLRAGVIAPGEAVGGIVAKSRSTHMLEIMGKILLRFAIIIQPVVVHVPIKLHSTYRC